MTDSVWVLLHELTDDLAAGPFASYTDAEIDRDGYDDVYASSVPREWFDQRRTAIEREADADVSMSDSFGHGGGR